jgi:hypothetical protein
MHEGDRGVPRCGEQERVSIGVRIRDLAGANGTAPATDVLDDDPLRQLLSQGLCQNAGHQIDTASRSHGHHQLYRPDRPRHSADIGMDFRGYRREHGNGNHERIRM